VSRLILSPNKLKWASTWHTSPWSTIGCAQNDFHAYGTFSAKACTYVVLRLIPSPNRSKWASTRLTSPMCTIGCARNGFHAHGTFGTNRAPILRRDWHLTHLTLEYHRVYQNNFWAYGLFGQTMHPSCTRLRLSPSGLKQSSTWYTLPRSTIRCAQSNFHARGTFGANCAPILHRD
jgi:hypothetical protein